MYRIKDIQKALFNVVGWQQSYDPTNAIETELTRSESGLTFQAAHPLLTLKNIRAIMPDDFGLQFAEWNMLTYYYVGDIVRYDGILWICKKQHSDQQPTASDFNLDYSRDDYGNPYWKPYNPLSEYLRTLTRDGITEAVQHFAREKQIEKQSKSLLERKTFFDGAGRLANVVQNKGNIVGFEIVPLRSMGVTVKIERVGLQFAGAKGVIKLYLYHSSQSEPIKTFDLEFDGKDGTFKWFDLSDCYLPYIGANTDSGGSYYLCYKQDELPFGAEAINVSKDWSREPCGSCNVGSVADWRELTRYIQISPFKTAAVEGDGLWDISQNIYTNTSNYGLNCCVSVCCDLTDFIISQRSIFAEVIQKQVAVMALRTMALNPEVRVNRNQINAERAELLYEIDGNTNGYRPNGLGAVLANCYKAININTQGIDRICLACKNKGVRYTSV